MENQSNTISMTTIVLHWATALMVLTLITLGLYMSTNQAYELYSLHSSIGLLAFFTIAIRIIWRVKSGWPKPLANRTKSAVFMARALQASLLLCTLMLPIAGILMSIAGGQGLYFFGIELVTANINPANPYEPIPLSPSLASLGVELHILFASLVMLLLCLHIGAALVHHFIKKDRTLSRMLKPSLDCNSNN